jgi:hypothetical protein
MRSDDLFSREGVSAVSTKRFRITPLGAAVVEAMPDKKMVAKVNHDFKKYKMCPMSELFDFDAVKAFYGGSVIPMPQHLYRSKKAKK